MRCFNHFKANIKDKLKDLHFEQHPLHSIIADIIGHACGGIKELGLVDADEEDDFKAKFNSLEDRWNELESKSRMISADTKELQPEFFYWFKKCKCEEMCTSSNS